METAKFIAAVAVALLALMVLSDATNKELAEPAHIEDWRMFSGEERVAYFYDARNGTLLRVHLAGTHPDFPFGYVAHVPFAVEDESGRLVRGDFADRLFGAERFYRRDRE